MSNKLPKKESAPKQPPKRPQGRPPKAVKEINPVRQVGRWSDESWQVIRDAAEAKGMSVAEWARDVMLRAAKRQG